MAARKKGDLVLYSRGLFPTEARKPPSCPLVKPKMDLYCLLLDYRLEPSFDRDCSSLLGAFSVTRDPSQHRQGSLDSSRSGWFGRKLIVAYLTPFLIIKKICCPFPLSLRRWKASLTVNRLQQGEPSLFGSPSTQCRCGTLPFLVPIEVTLFTGRPHGSKKKRRSYAILW